MLSLHVDSSAMRLKHVKRLCDRSFGILLNCMNYKYALWSLIEPKRGGGSVLYRVLQKISIRLMRVSNPKQRCPVLLFCVILTVIG